MSQVELIPSEEDPQAEKERSRAIQQTWLSRINAEERAHKDFRERSIKVQEVMNNDLPGNDRLYVPLLWSVVQVQHSGVYSSQPVPDVRSRNDEKNPIFRTASDVIERAIAYFVDQQGFDNNFHRAVDDFLGMGLGICRIKLDSEITESMPDPMSMMGQDPMSMALGMGGPPMEPVQEIGNQSMRWEYVSWSRLGWEPCNSWDHCDWIYFRHRMTQAQIRDRFGREVKASKDELDRTDPNSWQSKTFDIYEIWDKENRKVVFLAKGEKEPLEVNDDPLELLDFFPIPRPMMTNVPSDELIPQPDYNFIESYDSELNRLQERRRGLIEQIKATGCYDAAFPELSDILEMEDGEMKPVTNVQARLKGGGLDSAIFFRPIEDMILALQQTVEQIAFVKANVDEIMGISDIVRGVSVASESATAQAVKNHWVGVRLQQKRDLVQYTVREMFRIMGQLITSHLTDENLQRLTQLEIEPQVLELLRSDLMMDFAIDIEAESTVAKDEFKERETRQEMLQSVGAFAQTVLPMVQQGFLPASISSAIMKGALQPYTKYSRELDEALGELMDTQQQLQGMAQQNQQLTGQLQQVQAQLQQWQGIAQQLQLQSTEAKSAKEMADAGKKVAETEKIRTEIGDEQIQPMKTVAEIGKLRAETRDIQTNPPGRGQVQ